MNVIENSPKFAERLYRKGLIRKETIPEFISWMNQSSQYFKEIIGTAEFYWHCFYIYKKINNPAIKQQHILVASGKVGKGKTTALAQACALIDPTFNSKRVYYVPHLFFKGMSESKVGQAHLIDEGGNFFKALDSMGKTSKFLGQYFQMMRSKRLFLAIAYDEYDKMSKEIRNKVDSIIVKIPDPNLPIPLCYRNFLIISQEPKLLKVNEEIMKKKLQFVNIAIKNATFFCHHTAEFPVINDVNEEAFNDWKDTNRSAFERKFMEDTKVFDVDNEEQEFKELNYMPISKYAKKVGLHPETIKRKIKEGVIVGKLVLGKWMVNMAEETILRNEDKSVPVGDSNILINTTGGADE